MVHVFGFVEYYLVPFVLAIGLVLFLYGVINYYIIGPGDEERREIGRQSLLWAALLFFIGLCIFAITRWIFTLSTIIDERIDVEVTEDVDTLEVPNVPGAR